MQTILITGCSSGFGLEIARYFLEHDWKVIATMRKPREDILPRSENLRVLALDVADPESIRQAIEAAGPIDVLVNNAGIGFLNAVEGTPMETAREIFETNTLGTIAMTQAVLPQFRQHKAGVVVNVTSSVTVKPLHLLSIYTASKAAVNAFTESPCVSIVAAYIGSGPWGRWTRVDGSIRSEVQRARGRAVVATGEFAGGSGFANGWDQRCDAGALAG